MTADRKILIILAVLVIAMGVLGFKNKENYNYNHGNNGQGFNLPNNCMYLEYTVSHSDNIYTTWDTQQRVRQIQEHLNNMGRQGWELISVEKGSMSDQYTLFFMRPASR